MPSKKRRKFTADQKASIVLSAMSGKQTIAAIAAANKIHPTQVNEWKRIAQDNLARLFIDKRTNEGKQDKQLIDELYKIIGKREIELEWLKKAVS